MNNQFVKESDMDSAKLQSSTIDLLRFPLAIMVMFIHMNPSVINLIDADFSLLSGRGILNVTEILLSHVLTTIAVPTFYLISGFLFFVNFQEWSWAGYKKKMRSRVKTLLIPYILWNAVPFLLLAISMLAGVFLERYSMDALQAYLSNSWHIFYDYSVWGTTRINWLGDYLRMTGPFDLPLWFLRDLIVVTILTPVIYYAIKKLKTILILVLFIAYISRIWTLLPGFHITAVFYFTLGSYFALNKMNIIEFTDKYKLIILPICIMLLIVTTVFDGVNTVIGQNIYPLYVCTGVFSAFYLASKCITKCGIKPNKLLVSSCFFIYAFHGVSLPIIGTPLGFTTRVLHTVIPGDTGLEEAICYLVSPFVTAYLCVLILMIARRWFPKLTLYFSGYK